MNDAGIYNKDIIMKYLTRELNITYEKINENSFINSIVESYTPISTMYEREEKPIYLYQLIEDYGKTYYFSEYYDILDEFNILTPKSIIVDLDILFTNPEEINNIILNMPNQKCFARLDSCSSKPDKPFRTAQEIIESISKSERTKRYLNEREHKLILRDYIDELDDNNYNIRCIIQDKILRGISGPYEIVLDNENINKLIQLKRKIKTFINHVIEITEYDNATIDLYISHDFENIMLIEINTPVWLYASSGLFDIKNQYDSHLLFEDIEEDLINEYPEMRITNGFNEVVLI